MIEIRNFLHIIEDKAPDESNVSIISITSIAGCLQALKQCHETINEQDASTFVILPFSKNRNLYSF
jgi:hypothetical protein